MIKKIALYFLSLLLLVIITGTIFINSQKASHEGNWTKAHAVLPQIEIKDGIAKIKSLRDFRYNPNKQPNQIRYYDDEFNINEVKRLWFALSHFAEMGMAHNLLSFEFNDGRFLTLSVEARMEEGQEYDPLLGLFRQFEMIYVLGSEEDIIGLRSHVRREPVYLYPMTLSKQTVKDTLVTFLKDAQQLSKTPRFYNTLFNNCLSQLLLSSGAFNHFDIVTDWRLMLPGYSHEVAHELGYIDPAKDINAIQNNALIDARISPESDHFSQAIRL